MLAQSRHQEVVIEIVEQPPDVELDDPVLVQQRRLMTAIASSADFPTR